MIVTALTVVSDREDWLSRNTLSMLLLERLQSLVDQSWLQTLLLSFVDYETLLMLVYDVEVFLISARCNAFDDVITWAICSPHYISSTLKSLLGLLKRDLGI